MEERVPLLKQLDLFVFKKIDEFRTTPAYAKALETYTSLEENEQKVAKAIMLAATAVLPLMLLFAIWLKNFTAKNDLAVRAQLIERMQDIIAQSNAAAGLTSSVAAQTAFNDEGAMGQQVTSIGSGAGFDASKLRISNFMSAGLGPQLNRSEADFQFNGLSTGQLMTLFTSMMTQARFRISNVAIKRNASSSLLDGTFHAVHFGQSFPNPEDQ